MLVKSTTLGREGEIESAANTTTIRAAATPARERSQTGRMIENWVRFAGAAEADAGSTAKRNERGAAA